MVRLGNFENHMGTRTHRTTAFAWAAGCLARQRVRRAPMEVGEIRRGLSQGLQHGLGGKGETGQVLPRIEPG